MWQDIYTELFFENAWKDPHMSKAIYLLKVWQGFQSDVHLKTHETQERSPLLVPNVTSHLQWGVIWRTMKESTQEKSHLLVQSVRSDSQKVVIWKSMKGPTQERSHLLVQSVRSHSQKVVISESMKGPTQERSHLPVPNVTSHSTTVDSLCFVTKNRHLQFCGLLQFSRQFPGYQFFH